MKYEIYVFNDSKNSFIRVNKILQKHRNYYFFNNKEKIF